MNELLRQIRVVLMDIDGTLVRGSDDAIDHVVTQLRKLKPLGIRFSIATGRTLFGAQRFIREMTAIGMRMPPVIAYNGAVVAWPEDSVLVHRFTLPAAPVRALLAELRRRLIRPFVYTCQERFDAPTLEQVFGDGTFGPLPATDFNGMPVRWVRSFDEVPQDDVVAILGEQPDRGRDIRPVVADLQSDLGAGIRITSSGNRYIEVAHPHSTKANALGVMSRHLGVSASQVMAIGDNFNDMELLAACGVGVAVANAPAAVKEAAQYVCKREAAEGVIESLRLLLGAARQGRIETRVREEHHDAC